MKGVRVRVKRKHLKICAPGIDKVGCRCWCHVRVRGKQKQDDVQWLPQYEWLQEAIKDLKSGRLNEYHFGALIIERLERK